MREAPAIETLLAARASAVVVIAAGASSRFAAIELARSLGLPFHDRAPPEPALLLVQTDTRLELHDSSSGARLYVEFTAAELRRYRAGGPGGDPLRRALGPGDRDVVDATAGLGGDAVHLAALGYRVTAIERHPIVSALAQDGLRRARAAGLLGENPLWRTGDARVVLPALAPSPAAIYLDPMFPAKRKKSAAVRKEMRLLRLLVADDNDAAALLAGARRVATDRVVVKRPVDAPPLAPGSAASYRGKLVRYDVYRPERHD